jgi:hypothetical protein
MLHGRARPLFCRPNESYVGPDAVLEIVGYIPLALTVDGVGAMATGNAKPSQEECTIPTKIERHQDETESEIEAREVEELRFAEEEYAAEALQQELRQRMENVPEKAHPGGGGPGG